jgi:hypothetical protein
MIIFGEPELESFVFERRDRSNTQFLFQEIRMVQTNCSL